MKKRTIATVVAATFASLPQAGISATIVVNNSGDQGSGCTFRDAISSVNSQVPGAGCSPVGILGSNDVVDLSLIDGLTVSLNFAVDITAHVDVTAPSGVTLSGGSSSLVLNVSQGGDVSMNNVSVSSGFGFSAACITVDIDSTLTMANSRVQDCRGDNSPVALVAGTLEFRDSILETATSYSGTPFRVEGTLSLIGTTIKGVTAAPGTPLIQASGGSLQFTQGTGIFGNTITDSAIILVSDGNVFMDESTITGNTGEDAIQASSSSMFLRRTTLEVPPATGNGISLSTGALNLENSTVSRADTGISAENVTLTMLNSRILNSRADGIYARSSILSMTGGEVNRNERDGIRSIENHLSFDAVYVMDNGRGGIRSQGSGQPIVVRNSNISRNAESGIRSFRHAVTIDKTNISANGHDHTSSPYATALSLSGSDLVVSQSTITGNFARGVGFNGYASNSLRLENSTISGNTLLSTSTLPGGGGIRIGGDATINNSTIANNFAPGGGSNIEVSGSAILTNTIVGYALGENCELSFSGTISADASSIIEDGSCATDALAVSPGLLPLSNNGGHTSTHALSQDSPARGIGNPDNCLTTDQRGVARNNVCDAGAFELIGQSLVQFRETTMTATEGARIAVVIERFAGLDDGPASARITSKDMTAVATADYQPLDTIVEWGIGEFDPQTISLELVDDDFVEENEAFVLQLSAESASTVVGAVTSVVVTIADDDAKRILRDGFER